MNLLITVVVAAVTLVSGASSSSCSIATLSKLLLDPYIDQCATDSKYSFTSGVQPDEEEVAGMCASDACHSLLADVEALNLTECTLPIGNNINLFADLIDYVSDQSLLTDPYIDQCATDSGYSFTSGVQPDAEEVAGMLCRIYGDPKHYGSKYRVSEYDSTRHGISKYHDSKYRDSDYYNSWYPVPQHRNSEHRHTNNGNPKYRDSDYYSPWHAAQYCNSDH
ncbi:hypothetical protein BBJ29_004111 [Phytophthora kernoviae]|uniref:Elicitin-like protein n=1 Tax=Phytophthora kernoviae TaxID=325452 RepID=A0A3F2RNM6_9STRA|nr:hypothetical protein BBJ29_004111 [Phytophthora kernoviae]RLN61224.1 hypothetical protein BBP00_00005522 [Phytophthora kernoviae]